jgi:hypothetical protein
MNLNGKKTHLTVLLALVYIAGSWFDLWPLSEEVLAALGFTGLSFLRQGVSTSPSPSSHPSHPSH